MRIFGVILAGGAGRRMGGADKAQLPFAGRRLVDHAVERFGPQVEALALSANGDPARFSSLGLPVLPDDLSLGPLSGVLSALRWATPLGASAVVSVPVDCPFLPGDLTPRLCLAAEASAGGLAMAAVADRVHPTFGLWPVALAPALAAFLGSGAKPKVLEFARAQGAVVAEFPDAAAFLNLNTPEDLAMAEPLATGPQQ